MTKNTIFKNLVTQFITDRVTLAEQFMKNDRRSPKNLPTIIEDPVNVVAMIIMKVRAMILGTTHSKVPRLRLKIMLALVARVKCGK